MNTIKIGVTVGLFFIILCTQAVEATEDNYKTAFSQVVHWQADKIFVPTVVEIPVSDITQPVFAVYENETGRYIPNYYKVTSTKHPIKILAGSNVQDDASMLVDGDFDTVLDVPLWSDQQGSVTIALQSEEPVTSSKILLSFAPHVARPLRVSLSTMGDVGAQQKIIAEKQYTSDMLQFPKTTAQQWFITLVYAQPLRISEVTLLQEDVEKTTHRAVRFLAQSGFSYDIYLNPDRAVSIPVVESGNLYKDKGVKNIVLTQKIINNPVYKEADVDEDGVPDTIDNCIAIANPEQIDTDGNLQGDVCDDYDRDNIINIEDNCPNEPNFQQQDGDADGIGDVCDNEDNRLTEKYSWIPWMGLGFAVVVLLSMFAIVIRRSPTPIETKNREE